MVKLKDMYSAVYLQSYMHTLLLTVLLFYSNPSVWHICSEAFKLLYYIREYKDLMDLRDPMVIQVMLETADPQESRDSVE